MKIFNLTQFSSFLQGLRLRWPVRLIIFCCFVVLISFSSYKKKKKKKKTWGKPIREKGKQKTSERHNPYPNTRRSEKKRKKEKKKKNLSDRRRNEGKKQLLLTGCIADLVVFWFLVASLGWSPQTPRSSCKSHIKSPLLTFCCSVSIPCLSRLTASYLLSLLISSLSSLHFFPPVSRVKHHLKPTETDLLL